MAFLGAVPLAQRELTAHPRATTAAFFDARRSSGGSMRRWHPLYLPDALAEAKPPPKTEAHPEGQRGKRPENRRFLPQIAGV